MAAIALVSVVASSSAVTALPMQNELGYLFPKKYANYSPIKCVSYFRSHEMWMQLTFYHHNQLIPSEWGLVRIRCKDADGTLLTGPGTFEWNFIQVIFTIISMIDGWDISLETAVRWM